MSDKIIPDATVAIDVFAKYDWLHPAVTKQEEAYRSHLNTCIAKAAHDLEPIIKQLVLTYLYID